MFKTKRFRLVISDFEWLEAERKKKELLEKFMGVTEVASLKIFSKFKSPRGANLNRISLVVLIKYLLNHVTASQVPEATNSTDPGCLITLQKINLCPSRSQVRKPAEVLTTLDIRESLHSTSQQQSSGFEFVKLNFNYENFIMPYGSHT